MSTNYEFLTLEAYRARIKQIRSELPYGYSKAFIDKYFPDHDFDVVYSSFKNFMQGLSYRTAYLPPYQFMPKIEEFLQTYKQN